MSLGSFIARVSRGLFSVVNHSYLCIQRRIPRRLACRRPYLGLRIESPHNTGGTWQLTDWKKSLLQLMGSFCWKLAEIAWVILGDKGVC